MRGKIIPYESYYCSRAQDIVEGNKNRVQRDVVSELKLEANIIDQIESHYSEKEVKTIVDYDGLTEELVKILSGEFVKKSFLNRLFSRN